MQGACVILYRVLYFMKLTSINCHESDTNIQNQNVVLEICFRVRPQMKKVQNDKTGFQFSE